MTRDPNWWGRLEAAFHGALELPPAERHAYLARVCGGDPELQKEVEEMLAAEDTPDAFDLERFVRDVIRRLRMSSSRRARRDPECDPPK
jgi:hypothetical protein